MLIYIYIYRISLSNYDCNIYQCFNFNNNLKGFSYNIAAIKLKLSLFNLIKLIFFSIYI